MESAVAVDEQNPAGDQLVKRGDAIQSIKGSDKIFTGEVKIQCICNFWTRRQIFLAHTPDRTGSDHCWRRRPFGRLWKTSERPEKRRCGCMSERHQTFPWRSSRQENGSNDGYRVRSSRQERDMDGTGHGPAVQEQREVTTFPFLKWLGRRSVGVFGLNYFLRLPDCFFCTDKKNISHFRSKTLTN